MTLRIKRNKKAIASTSLIKNLLVSAFGVSMSLSALVALAEDQEYDRPTERAKWRAEWHQEGSASDVHGKSKHGGHLSIEFRKKMLESAENERSKWGRMIPGVNVQGSALKTTSTSPTSFATTSLAAAVGTTWVNMGPTKADVAKNGGTSLAKSDAGRPTGIAFDPSNANIIYAAFAGGGMWKTTNGGTTWAPMTENLGTLSIGALALDPNNSSTVYLGLGDAFDGTGIGMVKSTDGGVTWSAPVYLGDSSVINAMQVAPTDSNIVMAATNRGLYRSSNAGATWSLVSLPTGQTAVPYIWTIAWTGGTNFAVSLEANPGVTTGTTDGQVMTTTNAGASWTKATGYTVAAGIGRSTIAAAPSNRNTLYAMAAIPNATSASDLADILKSTNGGVTWTALGVARKRYTKTNTESSTLATLLNGQGWYNHMVQVDPTNANVAYFGGALLVAKTSDGGSTFTQKSNWLAQYSLAYVHADFHTSAMQGSTLIVGTDGGLFKSTDGGTTFTDALNIGLTTHLIYSVGSSAANVNAVIGGFQDNGTRVRSGTTTTFNQYIGGDGFGSAVHRTNANTMLGSLYYTRVYKSTDGGLTFAAANTGITESNNSSTAPFNTGITTWEGAANADTIFTWANAKVYKSVNYAGAWTALGVTGLPTTSFYIRGVGVATSNVNVVGIVANGGRVFLTNNGGTSWTTAATPPNNGSSLSKIAFDPTNPAVIYLTSVAADATKSHVWKSVDSGLSWASIDGGGLPVGAPVNFIKVDPNSTSTIYAGTHFGVYRSVDGGTSWARFGTGMPLVNVDDIYISADSSLVRAASFGRGFWQLNP
ncbi:MAG: hypothetical protein V4447_14735 [Pseudomonadota bacterium]